MLALVAALAACAGATALEKGVFDYLKLKNWTDEAIEAACGVDGASFRPSNPQPLTCIVTCAPVIDPLTGAESEGGWERDHRIYPADTNRVLNNCSNLSGFSLTLTDDPNLATFRAYITFTYKKGGTFNYRDKGAKIPKYDGVVTVKLVNLLTGESATMSQDCWCFYAGEGVRVSALDEGIGRQFYAAPTGPPRPCPPPRRRWACRPTARPRRRSRRSCTGNSIIIQQGTAAMHLCRGGSLLRAYRSSSRIFEFSRACR